MTIKHLVIGGGGPGGFINYGVLKRANIKNIWKYENIETLYCTSAGTIIGLLILLNLDWLWIDDYLIKRPWNQVIKITTNDYWKVINNKGIFNQDLIKIILEPLLKSVDLDITSTLQDLYNKFPKEFHCFTCNINSDELVELVNISYKTHPDLSIVDAIFMSCSIPLLTKPICENNNCYVDGGFLANVPINECLKETNCMNNEILVTKYYRKMEPSNIDNKTTTWSYLLDLTLSLLCKLVLESENKQTSNVCIIEGKVEDKPLGTWKYWIDVLNLESERECLINGGEESLDIYIKNNPLIISSLKFNYYKIDKEFYNKYTNSNLILKRSYSF